jgi:hypothetical protein
MKLVLGVKYPDFTFTDSTGSITGDNPAFLSALIFLSDVSVVFFGFGLLFSCLIPTANLF